MITTILKKQLQQEEIMLKVSKFITILVVFFSTSNIDADSKLNDAPYDLVMV